MKAIVTPITINRGNVDYYMENPHLISDEEFGTTYVLDTQDLVEYFASGKISETEKGRWDNHVSGMMFLLNDANENAIIGKTFFGFPKKDARFKLTKKEIEILEYVIPAHDTGKYLMQKLFSFGGRFSKFQHALKDLHALVGATYLANNIEIFPKKYASDIIITVAEHHKKNPERKLSRFIKALDVFQSLLAKDAARGYQDPETATFAKSIVFEKEKGQHDENIMSFLFEKYEDGKLRITPPQKDNIPAKA